LTKYIRPIHPGIGVLILTKKILTRQGAGQLRQRIFAFWYKEQGDPYADAPLPDPSEKIINELSNRYIYVYEKLSGQKFEKPEPKMMLSESRIEKILSEP
jgi:hypothetical protein